ncbi:MAG TPA: hypothetical protein H9780_12480 [Candidatus Mediterraneibacter merdavium]|nr:hypothetical protein [Candidatus Mediterraneibacter merdavium]
MSPFDAVIFPLCKVQEDEMDLSKRSAAGSADSGPEQKRASPPLAAF